MFRDIGIEPSAGTYRPLQRSVVHRNDAESGAQTLDPLEVVHQRPVVVALHIDAVFNQSAHFEKVVVDVPGPEGVFGIGCAIFGNEDGRMVAIPVLLADTIQSFRIYLPPEIVLLAVLAYLATCPADSWTCRNSRRCLAYSS